MSQFTCLFYPYVTETELPALKTAAIYASGTQNCCNLLRQSVYNDTRFHS